MASALNYRIYRKRPLGFCTADASIWPWDICPSTGSGFCQQRLFKDRFVCAVRANHSRIEHTFSLEQFEREPHVVLTMPGSGIEVVEKALEANRIRRKVRLRLPGCFGISSMITGADCLAIVPEQLGKTHR